MIYELSFRIFPNNNNNNNNNNNQYDRKKPVLKHVVGFFKFKCETCRAWPNASIHSHWVIEACHMSLGSCNATRSVVFAHICMVNFESYPQIQWKHLPIMRSKRWHYSQDWNKRPPHRFSMSVWKPDAGRKSQQHSALNAQNAMPGQASVVAHYMKGTCRLAAWGCCKATVLFSTISVQINRNDD